MNRLLRTVGLASIFLCCCVAPWGCASRAPATKSLREGASVESAEKQLRIRLENDPDESTLRESLEQFNSRLGRKNVRSPLSDADLAILRDELHLGESDLAEVERPDFSSLDAAHLNESMLLSAIVRGLDLDKQPTADRARSIVEWVGRQVYIHPRNLPPGPVWYVVQSGFGSATERAYVMLALLRQGGFRAALVGLPSASTRHSFRQPERMEDPEAVANAFPFLAVGVLVDKDVLLFDPTTGRAIPAADGKSTATLAATRAAAAVDLYLCPPLSALSMRIKYLEELISNDGTIGLFASVAANRTAFEAANLGGAKVLVWNPIDDFYTPTRTLSRYLPTELGGLDPRRGCALLPGDKKRFPMVVKGPEAAVGAIKLLELFLLASLPDVWQSLTNRFPGPDRGQARQTIRNSYLSRFDPLVSVPGSTRDKYLRGKVNEAMQQWTARRNALDNDLARVRNQPKIDEECEAIYNRVVAAEADLVRAKSANRLEAVAAAEQNLQNGLGALRKAFVPLTVRDTGDLLNAEYTYSLALAVHEKAERYQSRASTANAVAVREAWDNASDWWQRYLANYPEVGESFRDRNRHIRQLADRAKSFQTPQVGK